MVLRPLARYTSVKADCNDRKGQVDDVLQRSGRDGVETGHTMVGKDRSCPG